MKKHLKRLCTAILSILMMVSAVQALWLTDNLSLKANAATVIEEEDNNTFRDANPVPLGSTVKGNLDGDGDYEKDIFKVEIPSAGELSFSMNAYMEYMAMAIYDSDGYCVYNDYDGYYCKNIHWNSVTEKITYYVNLDLLADNYYICLVVRTAYYSGGDYDFKTTFTPSDESFKSYDSDMENANTVSLEKKYKGFLAVNDGKDFYKFSLSSNNKINLSITAWIESLNIYIFDNSGFTKYSKADLYCLYRNKTTKKISFSDTIELNAGTYYLCFEKKDGTGVYDFKISDGNKPKSIKLSDSVLNINIGKSKTIKAVVQPGTATNKTVTWSSSNTKVATVDKNGKVKAVSKGTATITAKTVNGKTSKCTVTVKIPSTKIKLNKTKATLKKGKTLTLKAAITPKNTTDKLTWSTSNKKVATVKNGKITAKKAGTATITVKTSSGKKATCKITVKKK